MLDQGSVAAKHKSALEGRLARLLRRIEDLRADPRRAPALRAAEIERRHIERELAALAD